MIKQIEYFRAELHADVFPDSGGFRHGHVKVEKSRANQSISLEIADEIGTLKRKSRWIIPLIYPPKDRVIASTGHEVRPLTRCPGSIVKTDAIESSMKLSLVSSSLLQVEHLLHHLMQAGYHFRMLSTCFI